MPSLADVASVRTTSVSSSTSLTTTVSASAGDVLVVKAVTADFGTALNTPTDTQGNTYTLRASSVTSSHCNAYLWTTRAASSTSVTVTHTRGGNGAQYSAVTEVWHNADLAATPATFIGTGTGTPSSSLTTTAAASAVSWASGDWSANSPTGRTYNTTSATPVEEFVDDQSPSTYVGYHAYQSAASAGSQTAGVTAPGSQTWTMAGVEVLDVPVGPGADQNQFGYFPWV